MKDDIARDEIIQGLLYAHTRSNLNTIETHHARTDIVALLELLIARGIIDRAEFDARRGALDEDLRREFVEKGMTVAINDQETSKYEKQDSFGIDCENRVDLCKAACCRLSFALSKEDVEEGIVKWDLGRPYVIAQGVDGYCTHLCGPAQSCAVYEKRPMTCREFDCRKDNRIWQDFDNRVPNPHIGKPDWLKRSEDK